MSEAVHVCQKRVYAGSFTGHPCGKTAKFEFEGKWYCKTHHPPTVKVKGEARTAQWNKEWEEKRRAQKDAADRRKHIEDSVPRLLIALKPFVDFLDAFEAKPINGLDEVEIYGIHGGVNVDGGSSLLWEHLRAARDAVRATVEDSKLEEKA